MCCVSPLDILEPVNVYYTSLLAQFRYIIIKGTTFLRVSPPDEHEPIIFCMKHPPPEFTYIFVLFYFSVVINTDMAAVWSYGFVTVLSPFTARSSNFVIVIRKYMQIGLRHPKM
jgi:hypothetical protein